ncbi:hypothetical protein GGR56DRAFT_557654 [Xylariaceae sp. FL0804]|nr:hypothetical protein GGR56DRAFT_557654 [Xylariaceae sp. FL0804]
MTTFMGLGHIAAEAAEGGEPDLIGRLVRYDMDSLRPEDLANETYLRDKVAKARFSYVDEVVRRRGGVYTRLENEVVDVLLVLDDAVTKFITASYQDYRAKRILRPSKEYFCETCQQEPRYRAHGRRRRRDRAPAGPDQPPASALTHHWHYHRPRPAALARPSTRTDGAPVSAYGPPFLTRPITASMSPEAVQQAAAHNDAVARAHADHQRWKTQPGGAAQPAATHGSTACASCWTRTARN